MLTGSSPPPAHELVHYSRRTLAAANVQQPPISSSTFATPWGPNNSLFRARPGICPNTQALCPPRPCPSEPPLLAICRPVMQFGKGYVIATTTRRNRTPANREGSGKSFAPLQPCGGAQFHTYVRLAPAEKAAAKKRCIVAFFSEVLGGAWREMQMELQNARQRNWRRRLPVEGLKLAAQ